MFFELTILWIIFLFIFEGVFRKIKKESKFWDNWSCPIFCMYCIRFFDEIFRAIVLFFWMSFFVCCVKKTNKTPLPSGRTRTPDPVNCLRCVNRLHHPVVRGPCSSSLDFRMATDDNYNNINMFFIVLFFCIYGCFFNCLLIYSIWHTVIL